MRYIQIVRELDLEELMSTLYSMLLGKEHEHWAYYKLTQITGDYDYGQDAIKNR